MPQLDAQWFVPQLVWLALTFLFLYIAMARVALPRVGGIIEERRDRIADDLEKANQLQEQAEKALADYEEALAQARSKATAIAHETRDKLKAEMDRMRADADAKLNAQLQEAEESIAKTKAEALSNVREVAAEAAGSLVSHLTGTDASASVVSKAVEAELAETGQA